MRSDAEIREFLAQWLMEWGSDWVEDIYEDGWYVHQNISRSEPRVKKFIDCDVEARYRINQAALDFIKGDEE